MIYNVNYSIAGLAILLVLYLSMRFQFDIDTRSNKLFRQVVLSAFVADFLDIVTAYTISYPAVLPLWAHYLLNIIFFIVGALCVFYLPWYLRFLIDPIYGKASFGDKVNQGLFLIYLFICITTPWTHWVIYFDENMVYQYGVLHSFLFITPVYYFFFGLYRMIRNRTHFTSKQIHTIVAFILFAAIGPLVQMIFVPQILISYFFVSIACMIVIMGVETPDYVKLLETMKELEHSRDLLEAAKKEEEEKSKTIHELTKAASWYITVKEDGTLVSGDWSEEFFWMLGYEKENLGERKYSLWEESIHPDDHDKTLQSFNDGLSGTKPYDIVYRMRSANGEYRWYRGTGEIKKDEQNKTVTYRGIIQDVNDEIIKENLASEKLAALEELEKSQEALKAALVKAESADRAKSDFLARMSHEIRTPINAILGMNELVARESREEGTINYSANIASAGNTLLSLVNDILDFSKIEAGKMEITPADYEVNSLIEETNNLIRMRCQEKGLEFVIKNNPDLPKKLFGDEVRIRQIIVNLLSNAVKYSEKGTVTLDVDYENRTEDSLKLKIAVKDSGMGIKEEDLDTLFDVFKRVENKHNHKTEGTGLGLSITKSFVELMGGEISVESTFGEGSVFTVVLPQKIVDNESLGIFAPRDAAGKEKYKAKIKAPGARVLIVDDVKINLIVMKGLLKETEITVDAVQSGQACLDKIKQEKYDLIFLDHMMPEMDGIETFDRMKADTDHLNVGTPTVMLTANAIMGAKEEYIASGFDEYMSKPVRPNELEDMLLKYIPKDKII